MRLKSLQIINKNFNILYLESRKTQPASEDGWGSSRREFIVSMRNCARPVTLQYPWPLFSTTHKDGFA